MIWWEEEVVKKGEEIEELQKQLQEASAAQARHFSVASNCQILCFRSELNLTVSLFIQHAQNEAQS